MRRTITSGCRRTSSLTVDTIRQPTSSRAARFWRSFRSDSGELCQSNPSYSTATRRSGHAKSTRHTRPSRSTISYCRTGSGSRPSTMTSRASLSIGDSASGRAFGMSSRMVTMPRRPAWASAAATNSRRSHVWLRRAASSVARARGRRRLRATSMAVQPGVVSQRPRWRVSGASAAAQVKEDLSGRGDSALRGEDSAKLRRHLGIVVRTRNKPPVPPGDNGRALVVVHIRRAKTVQA